MKAISVRAPWWWFILHAGKDIENRDWPTRFRGTVLLHASKWWNAEEVRFGALTALRLVASADVPGPLTLRALRDSGGAIVGQVDIVDCVRQSDSPWFFGTHGFVLRNPVAFAQSIPFKGALGFFDVPADLIPQHHCVCGKPVATSTEFCSGLCASLDAAGVE